MRIILTLLFLSFISFGSSAREVTDTLLTRQGDRIILSYSIVSDGDRYTFCVSDPPRIIPSENLRKSCKGDLSRLKAVIFDKVGDYGNVKWKGMTPSAFMVPAGLSYSRSDDGYCILGESGALAFTARGNDSPVIDFPVYVALYEKKRTYSIVGQSLRPLAVKVGAMASGKSRAFRSGTTTERIAVDSKVETEADNEDITKALGSIRMINQLLATETELPFSETLKMEVYSLRSLKERISDDAVIEKINNVLLEYNQKERELKDAQKEASLSALAQEQALQAQQKQEADAQRKEAEEKARIQEEKQQKRTIWMIIGGILLAVIAFIGNAVFKHFRDISNQKSIMQMQESLTRQAQHEASRRSREVIRNKAHQMANRGKGKLRQSLQNQGSGKPANQSKTNRKTI